MDNTYSKSENDFKFLPSRIIFNRADSAPMTASTISFLHVSPFTEIPEDPTRKMLEKCESPRGFENARLGFDPATAEQQQGPG